MVMEPVTASGWAKAVDAVKQWPLWLFLAVALSLSVVVAVPDFRNLIPEGAPRAWVVFAMVVAWIFTGARAVSPIAHAWQSYRAVSAAGIKFVVTPIEHQCHWGTAKQTDGSFMTQISGNFLVKNCTNDPLHLVTSRLIKPRMKGEVVHSVVLIRFPDSNMYGMAHVSGNFIPPHGTLPVSASMIIRGVPKQKKWSYERTD